MDRSHCLGWWSWETRFYDCVIACRHVIYLAIRCMHSCGCMSSSSTCYSLSANELSAAELAMTTIGAQRLPYVDLGGPPAIDEPIYLHYRPTQSTVLYATRWWRRAASKSSRGEKLREDSRNTRQLFLVMLLLKAK